MSHLINIADLVGYRLGLLLLVVKMTVKFWSLLLYCCRCCQRVASWLQHCQCKCGYVLQVVPELYVYLFVCPST